MGASVGVWLSLVVFSLAICLLRAQCDQGSITPTPVRNPDTTAQAPDGKSWFLFFSAAVTWCAAEGSCKDHGGHLASVLNPDGKHRTAWARRPPESNIALPEISSVIV